MKLYFLFATSIFEIVKISYVVDHNLEFLRHVFDIVTVVVAGF